jgi:CheY-like chemotaxis protein
MAGIDLGPADSMGKNVKMGVRFAETCLGSPGWNASHAAQANDVPGSAIPIRPEIEQPNSDNPAHNGCILVVDDNQYVRETLVDILEFADFVPVQATSAEQALMILRMRSDIDALLTDLSMPGADGITLIQRSRAIKPNMPAILLTGSAEEIASIASVAGDNFHVLRKPVESDRLIERLLLLVAAARQG